MNIREDLYNKYSKTKVRVVESHYINNPKRDWWVEEELIEVKIFQKTPGYKRWLKEKEIYDMRKELQTLNHNLTAEFNTYGWVDDVTYKYFLYLAAKLESLERLYEYEYHTRLLKEECR